MLISVALVHHHQQICCTMQGNDKLMDAFRGVGYNVTTTDELRHALTTGIQSRKPTIINVVIDPAAGTESGHITKLNPKQVAGN